MKILIVEDEPELMDSIKSYLSSGESFVCETAANFREATEKINLFDYACIILDITLPDGNGLHVLEELKAAQKSEGVIIISARNSLDDKIRGLNAGADDYLVKPFHLPELGARLAAIIRRKTFAGNNVIHFDEIKLDLVGRTTTVKDLPVDLTRKEYEILVYLIGNKNKVISKSALAAHLWGDEMDTSENFDFIYTHIKNLRKKLVQAGCPDYIRSIYGIGYKFTTA